MLSKRQTDFGPTTPCAATSGISLEPVYAKQTRHIQDGLRLAGERDHADEDADFGVPADGALHSEAAGRTPRSAPGATTIRTPELVRLLAEARPVVIDAVWYARGACRSQVPSG